MLDKITKELEQRFSKPLPEFYKRRIIFWHDEDRHYEDRINELELVNAKVAVMTGSNNFAIKKLLGLDDTSSNYLVYCPLSYDDPEDNWLLDVELYSEDFRSDMISSWMDEMGIPQTPAMRKQVKEYYKYFRAKAHREKLSKQSKSPAVPAQLHMAVMGALGGLINATPTAIIKEVLSAGLENETNFLYCEFEKYGAGAAFWKMTEHLTGYGSDAHDLKELAAHVVLTAATGTMRSECFAGLESYISPVHEPFCYDLVFGWLHGSESSSAYKVAQEVEDQLELPKRFMKLSTADLLDTEIFPSINEVLLVKTMTAIEDNTIDETEIKRIAEKRRTLAWYEDVKDYYEGVVQFANMQEFYKEHAGGFHTVEPAGVFKEYIEDYYMMDTYYRLFHNCYDRSLKAYNSDLHDHFSRVCDKAEGLYKNWFLGSLGENWTAVCADDLKENGFIPGIPKQMEFYANRIRNATSRVFVIISDAMRYEVAATLKDELAQESQCEIKLNARQAVFPTVTKFGMAALLPHDSLSVEMKSDRLAVLADGKYTDSAYRDGILKAADPDSIAVKYNDIVGMKRQERSTLVKGKNVVYIYHDAIDKASHTADTMVFPACEDAIVEIKNLIKIIVNDFGGTNIIITADHGFLYTYSPLTEEDKVGKNDLDTVEVERRYAIVKKGAKSDYLIPVKLLDGDSEFAAFAPRENIRIKTGGGGLNFVHGGISLQEMVIPEISYHHLRNQYGEYKKNKNKYDTKPVEIEIVSSVHKTSNMIFPLSFYQKEPVSENREAATYQLYFADSSGMQISDVQTIIADKTSDDRQDRTFRCTFNLKSLQYKNTEIYYLIIADENGLEVDKVEFQIDIAFAVDEFSW